MVRRADFFAGRWPQGFLPLGPRAGTDLLRELEARAFLVDRAVAETNPDWQQPIPYCLLTTGTDTFCVRRRKSGTEQRLHGLYSVGLGGHVGPEDQVTAAHRPDAKPVPPRSHGTRLDGRSGPSKRAQVSAAGTGPP